MRAEQDSKNFIKIKKDLVDSKENFFLLIQSFRQESRQAFGSELFKVRNGSSTSSEKSILSKENQKNEKRWKSKFACPTQANDTISKQSEFTKTENKILKFDVKFIKKGLCRQE